MLDVFRRKLFGKLSGPAENFIIAIRYITRMNYSRVDFDVIQSLVSRCSPVTEMKGLIRHRR